MKKIIALEYLKTLSKEDIVAFGRRWNNKAFTMKLVNELKRPNPSKD